MTAERVLAGAVAAFVATKCAVLLGNTRSFPVLRAPGAPRPGAEPSASLLVPARDEAENLRRTLPTYLAQRVREILVLDDASTDGTAEIVTRAGVDDARLTLLSGEQPPTGWTGKTWACHQLATAATGHVLIFCDADVSLCRGAVDAVTTEAARQGAAMFSVFPRQETRSLGERVLVPLIDDVLLCFLPHRLLAAPIPAAATANGQLIMFTREAYQTVGGHAAVRASIVEDVRLALCARRARVRLGLALGGDIVTARMYQGYPATVAGLAKSVRAAHGGSRTLVVATAGWHLVAYTLPWARLLTGPGSDQVARRAWLAAAALAVAERAVLNAKTGRGSGWEALLMPITPLAALPVAARAMRRVRQWKGRRYA